MPILTAIGIALGAGTIVTDRFIHKIPNWLAIVLYSAAVALILAGMIAARNAGLIK
ncbi:MAG: hypothetical protein J5998_10940 [Clostridia bacterium]|nr:hypothetical protein [Clostridia bacterium]